MSEQISNIGPGPSVSRTSPTDATARAAQTRASESLRIGEKVEVLLQRSSSPQEATIQVRSTDGRSVWSVPERMRLDGNLPASLAQRMGQLAKNAEMPALRLQAEVLATAPSLVLKLARPSQTQSAIAAPGTRAWVDQQLRLAMPQSRPLGAGLAMLRAQAQGGKSSATSDATSLGSAVRDKITALLSNLPNASDLGKATGLAKAVRNSGIWMEAALGRGRGTTSPVDVSQDLKANLLQLARGLRYAQAEGDQAMAPAGSMKPPATPARNEAAPEPEFAADQSSVDRTTSLTRQNGSVLEGMTKQVDGMLKHLVSQQLQTLDAGADPPRWLMEIPFRTQDGVSAIEADLRREKRDERGDDDSWSLRINLDLQRLGQLSIDLNLRGDRVTAGLRCGTETGAALLRDRLSELRHNLESRSLEVSSIHAGFQANPGGQREIRTLRISERA